MKTKYADSDTAAMHNAFVIFMSAVAIIQHATTEGGLIDLSPDEGGWEIMKWNARQGGNLILVDINGNKVAGVRFGDPSSEWDGETEHLAKEKATRAIHSYLETQATEKPVLSSWETRKVAASKYGGAIVVEINGEIYAFGCSGLPEKVDHFVLIQAVQDSIGTSAVRFIGRPDRYIRVVGGARNAIRAALERPGSR